MEPTTFRAGYVAILGKPNAGKSTLLNTLLQQKISIVTPKPQTTRHKILGIVNSSDYQILFLDTPGLLQPKYKLHEAMMSAAYSAINDADVVLLLIDGTDCNLEEIDEDISLKILEGCKKPVFLLINKIDVLQKGKILQLISKFSEKFSFTEYFPLSALKGENVLQIVATIVPLLPVHPPYYETEQMSDMSERFFVSEIIREKIFELCRQEIPYSTTVDIIEFKEQEGKPDIINAEIILERDSQKRIVIGKKGIMLRTIGINARQDIEKFLGRYVYLELYVKVREDWRESDNFLKQFGYK
ncbi:MAG: GTPase Era [Bacteroidota bacterium]|mgnify:CR=1 FL=1